MRTIDIGIDKIDKIYHIADVHVRNVKRHKEYREVLDLIKAQLVAQNSSN